MDEHRTNDIDTGLPVEEISLLREAPSARFGEKIQGGIQRRIAASDALEFSLFGFFKVLFGYLMIPFQLFGDPGQKEHK